MSNKSSLRPETKSSESSVDAGQLTKIRNLVAANTGPKFGYTYKLCQAINYLLSRMDELKAENEIFRAADYSALTDDPAQRMKEQMIAKVRTMGNAWRLDADNMSNLFAFREACARYAHATESIVTALEKVQPSASGVSVNPDRGISAGNETKSSSEVESCLAELREMFPNRCINLIWSVGIAAGQQVTIHLINPEANGTDWGDKRFSQPTLAEALSAAREYYDDGREADIDARQAARGDY